MEQCLMFLIGRTNTLRTDILPKLIYRFIALPIRISTSFLTGLEKTIKNPYRAIRDQE